MGSKKVKSVSVDEDIAEAVDSDDSINLSGLVNEFLKSYFTSGESHRSAIQTRLDQIEEEIDETQDRLDQLRKERQRLEELLEQEEAELEPMRRKCVDLFYGRDVEPDNPGVENWAVKMGMTPKQLLESVPEWAEEYGEEPLESGESGGPTAEDLHTQPRE